MLIFAMDTTGSTASVALMEDGIVRYECVCRNKRTHSQTIMPLTEEAFVHSGLSVKDVDYFAVAVGPGSYTGVRIAVAATKAMAHACQKPCISIDALEALAKGVFQFDGIVCPIMDARAGQVYAAIFDGVSGERLYEDVAMKIDEFIEVAREKAQGKRLLFVGDGVPVHQETIQTAFKEKALFASPAFSHPNPAIIASLATKNVPDAIPYGELAPLYLRAPQAVRERLAREQQNG